MSDGNCHKPMRPGDVHIGTLNLDHVDYSFLMAARYFFLTFSEPRTNAWLSTILSSESFFQVHNHAEVMRLALMIVHEMRVSRKSTMRFSNPRCPGCSGIVTEEERHLVQLVQAVREGRKSRAASSAMLLCEGNDTAGVLYAAESFAAALDRTSVKPKQETVSEASSL